MVARDTIPRACDDGGLGKTSMIPILCALLGMCFLGAIARQRTSEFTPISEHSGHLIGSSATTEFEEISAPGEAEPIEPRTWNSGGETMPETFNLENASVIVGNSVNCRVCGELASAGARMCICPSCSALFHDDCWEYNGGCAIFGCTSRPRFVGAPAPEVVPSFLGVPAESIEFPGLDGETPEIAPRLVDFRCRNCFAPIRREMRATAYYVCCAQCQFSIRLDPDNPPPDASTNTESHDTSRPASSHRSDANVAPVSLGPVFTGRSFSSQYLRRARTAPNGRTLPVRREPSWDESDQTSVGRAYRLAIDSGALSVQEPRTSWNGLRSAVVRDSSGNLWLHCGEGWEHVGHDPLPDEPRRRRSA